MYLHNEDVEVTAIEGGWDTVVVILTFNLALTQHLRAYEKPQGSSERRESLIRALELYKYCIGLEATSPYGVDWDCIHAMALLNNIGVVQTELENKNKARRLFQRLLSLMLYLREYEDAVDCSEHDWDGFLANATSSMMNEHHLAAAA